MYRLTISGAAPNAFLKQLSSVKPIKQKVYRWENKWGYLRKGQTWEESWLAEERTFVSSSVLGDNTFVVETYSPIDNLPPVNIDDLWEEEVVCDKNVTCNNLLSITGSNNDLIRFCKLYSIDLPPAVTNVISIAN